MKKLLLLLLVFPFMFASCSDDDDDYSNNDILGTWTFSKSSPAKVEANNKEAIKIIEDDIKEYSDDDTYIFETGGKVTYIDGETTENGTYTLNGNRLTLTGIDGFSSTVEISISGNTFTIYADETDYYKDEIKYLMPNASGVTVDKVMTAYTYKKK